VTAPVPKTEASQPANFLTIQGLRAVAALLVVLLHAFETWGERVDSTAPGGNWENGAAGVDIFFIISGFVMAISSRRLVDRARAW
jgi:exopolysaccharide production protein ExoZ